MGFYTIWVRSLGYRGHEPLTYSSSQKLLPGSLVTVPLQRETVLAFVEKEVSKPKFTTKPVSNTYDLPPLPGELLQLAGWLRDFYATNLGTVTSLLLPAGLSDKAIKEIEASAVNKSPKVNLTSLTKEQSGVVNSITKPDTYLLHGRTGSGKTRVYVELALQAVNSAKSALILTPEISLTSQLTKTFRDVFGEQVIVLHSQLTPAERQRNWLKILTVQVPLVVIGPRSALFSPLSTIGLIVIDEAHEPAYKQEQAPYYHARTVASELSRLHQASLIIGSATPSLNDYFLAEQRNKPILEMKTLAMSQTSGANSVNSAELQAPQAGHRPPVERSEELTGLAQYTHTQVVDLKDRSNFTRSQQLSTALLEAIQASVSRGEQSLLYLNRRGTARVVLCENCGWQAACPHCDLPLVYHADSGRFRCHICGHSEPMATSCPTCGHPSVLFKTFGTKAVAEEVQRLFPGAKVQRFDTDNLKAERFETHFDAVQRGDVDILVGTQLLAKGLDLPKLSTIGIIQADSSLSMPDFSAQERTYQLLSQVLGRVGRGHVQGHAVIQTYHPESPILEAAIKQDYTSFYDSELKERQLFHFPPFYYLLKLSTRRASYKSAEAAAEKLKDELGSKITGVEIDGPTPSFYEKLQGKYQVQLVARSQQRSKLLEAIKLLPSGWTYDIDPINLL